MYVVSLSTGVLVGVIYSLLEVRSPAPPLVALVGLLGILLGELLIPLAQDLLSGTGPREALRRADVAPHISGVLPESTSSGSGKERTSESRP